MTPSENRDSILRHGLDWRHGGGGIAGSRAPEQNGVFLARDRSEAEFFVQMGKRRFAALDIWAVTLDSGHSGQLAYEDELCREFDGFLCWMEPIPPSRLQLLAHDLQLQLSCLELKAAAKRLLGSRVASVRSSLIGETAAVAGAQTA